MSTNVTILTNAKETITSLELVEQINVFRRVERSKADENGLPTNRLLADITHDSLLKVIRDEFDEEISRLNLTASFYNTKYRKNLPMFVLTLDQAKQVLFRESKTVRKAVIKYIETLENIIKESQLPVQEAPKLTIDNMIEAYQGQKETIKLTKELTDQQ